jgi:hypothetical protein
MEWSVLASVLAAACIIPDTDIDVRPPRTNPGAVRIVEAVALTEAAIEACREVPIAGEPPELSVRETCPLPPITVPTGLIRPLGQTFCVCPEGLVDGDALRAFDIHVEDPDVDDEGMPRDEIYGVFLLDRPPGEGDVAPYIAYTNYLDPNDPAKLVALGAGSYAEPIERPRTNLKRWSIGADELVDLCNNNNGAKLDEDVRLHSLELIVTDRPWYTTVVTDENGAPERDDGVLVREGDPMPGIPDLPGGATYSTAHYVFECLTDAMAEVDVCGCFDPTETE